MALRVALSDHAGIVLWTVPLARLAASTSLERRTARARRARR